MTGRGFFALTQAFFGISPALLYLVAGLEIHGGDAGLSAGTIVAFTTLQTRLLFPINQLLQVSVDVQSSLALFGRVFEYLDLKPEITDRPGAENLPAEAVTGELELTLSSIAGICAVVTQESYLFHASVRENLRYGNPGASDAQVEEAASAAYIHDRIAELDDGYETIVGERGYRFRGGERQRLAIARVILKDPKVLSSTRPRRRWTPRANGSCNVRWSRSCAAGRRWRSRTASRRSAPPT
jgi:ABC-type multidrug transport system fused ATPase/permease subunit